jgi:hypothetical protein
VLSDRVFWFSYAVNSFWLYFLFLCTIPYYKAGDGQSETLSVGDVLFPLPAYTTGIIHKKLSKICGGPERSNNHIILPRKASRRCKHHFYIHYCLNKIGIKRIINMKHWHQNKGTDAWFERAKRIESWLQFSWSFHYYRHANPLGKLRWSICMIKQAWPSANGQQAHTTKSTEKTRSQDKYSI